MITKISLQNMYIVNMKLQTKKKQLHFFRCRSEVNQNNAPKFVSSKGAYINNKK